MRLFCCFHWGQCHPLGMMHISEISSSTYFFFHFSTYFVLFNSSYLEFFKSTVIEYTMGGNHCVKIFQSLFYLIFKTIL